MHPKYSLSSQAKNDLRDILTYIARDNLVAAKKMREKFREGFALLAEHPYIGQQREDITALPLRFWPVYSYQIIYNAEANPLQIIRILSGYRDIGGILQN